MKHYSKEVIMGLGEKSVRKTHYPELQEKMEALEKVQSRNRALLKAMPDVILVSDDKGHLTPFSSYGKGEQQLALRLMRNNDLMNKMKASIQTVVEIGEPIQWSYPFDHHLHLEIRMQRTELREVLILVRDITQRVFLENHLRALTETDDLTGLMNRRKCDAVADQFEDTLQQHFALVLLDIDGVKHINDTLGYLEGDRVISHVATYIKASFHKAEVIGRIGGNEFLVLTSQHTKRGLEQSLLDFHHKLEAYNTEHAYQITVSYGFEYQENIEVHYRQLYQLADNHMYASKLLKEHSGKSALVKTLMKALEAKDYITEGHADRMDTMAVRLGEALQIGTSGIDRLNLLTKFHDLGKVGIPDSILKKPGPLTDEEWMIMKTHTAIGERIASATPELKNIAELILKHHERYDGKGYPVGLSGKSIPMECRILCLVDAYDAMTNDRPYRTGMTHEDAIEEIKKHSGTQFDPQVVRAFLELV